MQTSSPNTVRASVDQCGLHNSGRLDARRLPMGVALTHFSECVESIWNVMAHGDAREGKWRGNWRMEWVASTLHTSSEHGVSSITTADAHTSAASSRLNWRPRRFKWTPPFCRKTKSGFCACAITFQTQSTKLTKAPAVTISLIDSKEHDGRAGRWLKYSERTLLTCRTIYFE
jgi:hypothetical protein